MVSEQGFCGKQRYGQHIGGLYQQLVFSLLEVLRSETAVFLGRVKNNAQ